MVHNTDRFYQELPRVREFSDLTRPAAFAPVPDDWVVATADIVNSTAEISNGRYKVVNMIGAAVISAMINAAEGQSFPFVFGGDGASFAVPPGLAETAWQVLSVLCRWAETEFDIRLRAAVVPIAAIRAAGHDVRVARFAVSNGVDYAMFSGGGLAWTEQQMKSGAVSVPPAAQGVQPDLTGLSCRWSNIPAQNGQILSLVILPTRKATEQDFADIANRVVEAAAHLKRGGHPVPIQSLRIRWPSPGLTAEAQASHGQQSVLLRKLRLLVNTLFSWVMFRTGIGIGPFDPNHYVSMLSANADFRKFDDGLKMTLDCDAETGKRIETLLEQAARQGVIRYGMFAQAEATVTCFVPSAVRDDHVHFVDGAAGGYTQAAAKIGA